MTTATMNKPANQLTVDELKDLLAHQNELANQEKAQKRADYESLRNATTTDLVNQAFGKSEALKAFKASAYADLEAMYKLLQEHSSRHADGKGNFSIENAESTKKVMFKRHDATTFDERATQAEKFILDFLTSEFGSDDPRNKVIKKLIERKKGKVDKDNVLQLAGMKDDFSNENWHKGIDLYLESIVPSHTKYYAQFFYRATADDAWTSIVLDFAKL